MTLEAFIINHLGVSPVFSVPGKVVNGFAACVVGHIKDCSTSEGNNGKNTDVISDIIQTLLQH